jgi:hypothetical protein
LDISRDTLSKVLAALKTLGIVETAGWKGNSESYTVHFFSDVADGLQVIHKEWKGVPAWDHERANKNFKSKNQKPTNEEKKAMANLIRAIMNSETMYLTFLQWQCSFIRWC